MVFGQEQRIRAEMRAIARCVSLASFDCSWSVVKAGVRVCPGGEMSDWSGL